MCSDRIRNFSQDAKEGVSEVGRRLSFLSTTSRKAFLPNKRFFKMVAFGRENQPFKKYIY